MILVTSLFTARTLISFMAFNGETVSPNISETADIGAVAKGSNIMQYAPIVEKNPFGSPMKFHQITAPGQSEVIQSEKVSITGLTLVGTVVGPDDMSYAIFENTSGSSGDRQEVFAQGEPVYNYGTLSKIHTNFVIIKQRGKDHTLEMVESDNNLKKNRATKQTASKNSFARKVGKRKYELDKRQVEQSIENPERILTDARLLPNFIDGKQEGFRISEVQPKGLYDNLGLKNGDILLRVNNLEISNPEVAIQAMSTLRGTNNVNLDIIRSGNKMSLNYQIK
jgi:general secretion pathway protein C